MRKNLTRNVGMTVMFSLLLMFVAFVMAPKVDAATASYNLGEVSYKYEVDTYFAKSKIGSKYYHRTYSNGYNKLSVSTSQSGQSKVLHSTSNTFGSNLLSNGSYAIYTTESVKYDQYTYNETRTYYFYKTKISTGARKQLFSIKNTSSDMKTAATVDVVSLYNNKLYYTVGDKLYSYSFKTKKKTLLVKSNFALVDANGHGRYIYGAKWGSKNVRIFDCSKGKLIKTLYGVNEVFSLRGSKLYYVKNNHVYRAGYLGGSLVRVLKNADAGMSEVLYIGKTYIYYGNYDTEVLTKYNMSTKKSSTIKTTYYSDWDPYVRAEGNKAGYYEYWS